MEQDCYMLPSVNVLPDHAVGKGKSCPCALTEYHAMKAYWGSRGIATLII
jgi:hypothetical protein